MAKKEPEPRIEQLMAEHLDAANRFFDDPAEALRVLVGRYYLAALKTGGSPGALMDTLMRHLPYARQMAVLGDETDWELRELQARASLEAFVHITKPDYEGTLHQQLICRRVQAAHEQDGGRLYIGMPPRHGKSEIASVRTPAWQLGRDPSTKILLIANTQQLADTFSRQCRDLVFGDPVYRKLFANVQPDPAKQAQSEWRTSEGGGVKAVGAGVSISGHGADLIIIDDPHGDDDWQNPAVLQRVYDWYTSAVRTRLLPGGSIVLLMTRWHVNDIVGRLLALAETESEADKFDALVLPGIAQADDALGRAEGQALWPERFDLDWLASQRALSEEWFEAQYQQNPVAFSDYVFRADWIKRGGRPAKADAKVFWTADFAISMTERSDYNVLARWWQKGKRLYMLDHRRYRGDIVGTLEVMRDLTRRYGGETLYLPDDSVEQTMKPIIKRDFPSWRIRTEALAGDKRMKSQLAAAAMSKGMVCFCNGQAGLDAFIEELLAFPNGVHDDCVDALSLAAWVAFGKLGEFQMIVGGRVVE